MVTSEIKHQMLFIELNRSEKFNALNEHLISEITETFGMVKKNKSLRAVVLKAAGKHFCAGADLDMMRGYYARPFKDNYKQSIQLFEMFEAIYACPVPVIAFVHGSAIGGGTGLVSVCDYVLAEAEAQFSFSEVKLGIIPATISPFVCQKIGFSNFNAFGLTGVRFGAPVAERMGLVHAITSREAFLNEQDKLIEHLKTNGPEAMKKMKLLSRSYSKLDLKKMKKETSKQLALVRVAPEGQEGMKAFFEKRVPEWAVK